MSNTVHLQNAQRLAELEQEALELKKRMTDVESTKVSLREAAAEFKEKVRAMPLEICWCVVRACEEPGLRL